MNRYTIITKNSSLIEEKFDSGEILLYDADTKFIHILDAVASFIWQNCENRSVAEIAEFVHSSFNISDETVDVHQDCVEISEYMLEHNLISIKSRGE